MKKTPKLRFPEFSGEWNHSFMKNVATGFDYGMNSASKEFDGYNKYIRITDIDDTSRKYIKANCVSPDGELEEKYLVGKDDILFTRTGASTGKTYLYNEEDGVLYFAGFLIRAKVNGKNNSKFIFLQTLTEKYNKWVKIMSMRSGQPGINSQEYSSYDFYAPGKTEQDRIAKFFSIIDKKIEKQQEKVEALEEYKKGIMQKIFSQEIRFKDENGEEYPKWEEKGFGELLTSRVQKQVPSQEAPLMAFTATGGIEPKGDRYDRSFLVKSDEKLYKRTELNDFIYSSNNLDVGSIGLNKYGTAVISDVYEIFIINKEVAYNFISELIKKPKVMSKIISYRQGVMYGQYRIHAEDFLKIKEFIPCLEEQHKISNFLVYLDKKFNKEQQKIEQLKEWKKGLLQQMFV